MANHDIILNTLFNVGLRQRELESILASNCVVDWFGRTVTGRAKVTNYYLNSNNCYEHSMANAETIDAFEERATHMSTRVQPIDNSKPIPEMFGDEQWYDCKTHTPVDLKESLKTPKRSSTSLAQLKCPPAPCRDSKTFLNDSDDDIKSYVDNDDSDDGYEEGIRPLDETFEMIESFKVEQPSKFKRQRLDKDVEKKNMPDMISEEESRYSNLKYLEVSGVVTIHRQHTSNSRNESERHECKMQVSYRINKEDANDIQIALIVYKHVNNSVKTRRNLMLQFEKETDDIQEMLNSPSTTSLVTPSIVHRSNHNEGLALTAPCAGEKVTKTLKRSITSRNCLRF